MKPLIRIALLLVVAGLAALGVAATARATTPIVVAWQNPVWHQPTQCGPTASGSVDIPKGPTGVIYALDTIPGPGDNYTVNIGWHQVMATTIDGYVFTDGSLVHLFPKVYIRQRTVGCALPVHVTVLQRSLAGASDTGWLGKSCGPYQSDGRDWRQYVGIRVVWYTDNQRYIQERAWNYIGSDPFAQANSTRTANLGFWVTALGGSWVNYTNQPNPNWNWAYATSRTPGTDPGIQHVWLARNHAGGGIPNCDLQVYN